MHVGRGWRQVVFGSPIRLDLQIICTSTTPVRKYLGLWPALPIRVEYYSDGTDFNKASNEDNIVYALEQTDRVCDVRLHITDSEMEKISAAMWEPFPELTRLEILPFEDHGIALPLPLEFLGGSAPRLQSIHLSGIPFPALPTLFLTISDLIDLDLFNIPWTGYISPEAMVVGLSTFPRLRSFHIDFQLASPVPDRIHPPPVTRTILPALTQFIFHGASEYLEDLVARIDAPRLDRIYTFPIYQLVHFQVAQLAMFIDRSVGPKLTLFRFARVTLYNHKISFHLSPYSPFATPDVVCDGIDWQVSHIAQVVSHFSVTLSNVVHLELEDAISIIFEGTDDIAWLQLLQQFPTVQTLLVSFELAGYVALTLEDIPSETVVEVLPSLDLIYLQGWSASWIEKFVAARQLSGHPVTVIDTEKEFYKRAKSYVRE